MTRFQIAPLSALSDVLTMIVMAGLTAASAAVLAGPMVLPEPTVVTLPTVVVTAKRTQSPEPTRLPAVVVTAKRASAS
ncbi:hypothetical protein [Inhella sp.]|uniref:hypothetical protein n=1 Tax=Inhella sp. TaxID=1921806 RepID=UPI0035B28CAC